MRSFAFREGYDAGWDFHMGSAARADNPYWSDDESQEYIDWEDGFTEAGYDS